MISTLKLILACAAMFVIGSVLMLVCVALAQMLTDFAPWKEKE